MQKKESSSSFISAVLWALAILAIVLMLLSILSIPGFASPEFDSAESTMGQASGLEDWRQDLRAFEQQLNAEQRAMWDTLTENEKRVAMAKRNELSAKQDLQQREGRLDLYQQDAANAEYDAKQQQRINAQLMQQVDAAKGAAYDAEVKTAVTGQPQKQVYGYADGSASVIETSPRHIVMTSDGPGLGPKGTQITIIQAPPVPTPLPTPVPRQETRINTEVRGVEYFGTRAVLPEGLTVEQLDAVKGIAEQGMVIGQQQVGLKQYEIQQTTQLEYLRIVKSFTLWGFLASIPFILTLFHIGKGVIKGLVESQKSHYDYKIKELEVSDHVIYGSQPRGKQNETQV